MDFGTLVLSVDRGLQSNYQMIERRHREVTLIKVGKYLFTRPDNGKMIIEIEGVLLEDKPNKLFPLNHASVEYFKSLIKDRYEDKKNEVGFEVNKLVEQMEAEQQKVKELQVNIETVEAKNKVEFSENREKTIRQLSKALRKHKNRMEVIERNIKELEEKIETYEKSKQYSLEFADRDMKKYL